MDLIPTRFFKNSCWSCKLFCKFCRKAIRDNFFPNMLSMFKRYERNGELSFWEEGGSDTRVGFSKFWGMIEG